MSYIVFQPLPMVYLVRLLAALFRYEGEFAEQNNQSKLTHSLILELYSLLHSENTPYIPMTETRDCNTA